MENADIEKIVAAIFYMYPTDEAVHLVTELIKGLNEVRTIQNPPVVLPNAPTPPYDHYITTCKEDK